VTLTTERTPLKHFAGVCPEKSELDATYVGLGTGLWLES